MSQEILILAVAWKLQVKVTSDLAKKHRRRLSKYRPGQEMTHCKPGTVLMRDGHGKTYRVLACEEGFQWNDQTWRSLSAVAQAITGVHWSGPRFFGVTAHRGSHV